MNRGKAYRHKHRFNGILMLMLGLLYIFFLNSCEEEFWPDLKDRYESLLVVEGMINNGPGPYTVKLSLSSSLSDPNYNPLPGCEVIISDDAGHSEKLTETEDGQYVTDPEGMQGEIGRSYKLTIHRPEGSTYESEYSELLQPVEIDTVYPAIEYKENPYFPFPIPGYQFYISTKPTTDSDRFISWQMIHTYEYNVDFKIYFYYDGVLHTFPDQDSLQYCWKTEEVHSIFTTTNKGLTQSAILNYPLHYIPFDNRIFSIGYSLFVNQLTIPEAAYNYWHDVKQQNTEGGSLYTQLPFQIRGNVNNLNDMSEPVLGYFQVAGVDACRIFVDRPPANVPMYYSLCELTEADYQDYGWMFKVNDPKEWPKYVTVDKFGGRAVPNPFCSDCRKLGGTIVKPQFWEK